VDSQSPALMVSRTSLEPCHVKLDIEVPVERVRSAFDDVIKQLRRSANVPGFRVGKAPKALLRSRFKKQINGEVETRLLREAVEEACETESLVPETGPRVENEDTLALAEDAPFCFAVVFDTAPSFELPEYVGISVDISEGEVDDDSVQEVINQWLQQRATYEQVDRPAEQGDLLKVTYHATLTDPDVETPDTASFLLDAEETWLPLRDPEFIPGAMAALTGLEAGAEKAVTVEFPEDYGEAALAGQSADYAFNVIEVHAAQIPEFTDDMAKEVGAEDASEARARIRQNLEMDKTRRETEATRQAVVQQIVSQVDLPLPPNVLSRETHQTFFRLVQEEMRQGKEEGQLRERQAELMQTAGDMARQRLLRYYVLGAIADEEDITVERPEIEEALDTMSEMHRVSPKVLRRRLRDSGRISDVIVGIREGKTVSFLVEKAEIEAKPDDQE
jgi:trigger factor